MSSAPAAATGPAALALVSIVIVVAGTCASLREAFPKHMCALCTQAAISSRAAPWLRRPASFKQANSSPTLLGSLGVRCSMQPCMSPVPPSASSSEWQRFQQDSGEVVPVQLAEPPRSAGDR